MWIDRDFHPIDSARGVHPLKILKGPRQVGKTALLERLPHHRVVYLDDLATRELATNDPRFFLDHIEGPVVLDEASLAPPLFPELKRRVDEARRNGASTLDVWITGSNQTLLHRNVRESLAGRASYFDLNTLSVRELYRAGVFGLERLFLRGGWPQLYREPDFDSLRYLNDLLATFVERDIVMAAGIERRAAFTMVLKLVAGRVGQLFNASDIARNAGVDVTTVQAWCRTLEDNGLLRRVAPWSSNLNQRLIKSPKYYLEDVGLAVRLQGWTSFDPLLVSPSFGALFENAVLSEVTRTFTGRGEQPQVHLLRTRDGVEVDFLVELGNQRGVAIEVKSRAEPLGPKQHQLLDSIELDVAERWVVARSLPPGLPSRVRALRLEELADALLAELATADRPAGR
jgi:hypothetical protein